MTGCDEEPRMFQGVCELSVTKIPKPNDKPSHQSQCKPGEHVAMLRDHGFDVHGSETGGRPAFTEDEAVYQLPQPNSSDIGK